MAGESSFVMQDLYREFIRSYTRESGFAADLLKKLRKTPSCDELKKKLSLCMDHLAILEFKSYGLSFCFPSQPFDTHVTSYFGRLHDTRLSIQKTILKIRRAFLRSERESKKLIEAISHTASLQKKQAKTSCKACWTDCLSPEALANHRRTCKPYHKSLKKLAAKQSKK